MVFGGGEDWLYGLLRARDRIRHFRQGVRFEAKSLHTKICTMSGLPESTVVLDQGLGSASFFVSDLAGFGAGNPRGTSFAIQPPLGNLLPMTPARSPTFT